MEIFDAVRNGLNLKHETCSEHLKIRIQDSNGGFLLKHGLWEINVQP